MRTGSEATGPSADALENTATLLREAIADTWSQRQEKYLSRPGGAGIPPAFVVFPVQASCLRYNALHRLIWPIEGR